ncbi:hypothetical protein EWM64_g6882 [Hericium alpestre]|uniref:Endoribonuclease YSH1 n=1 Tax=Hericium alpestre TaxID=135208 RepID=A0A4Y9ZQT3_9AGAM|nr:hypothetical protein EWM64_g6882 [Hericium alpestre]
MQDFVRMSSSGTDSLVSPMDLSMSLASVIPISAHQLITPCPGVSFTPYHAGHVLGACMYLIDIAGLKILYTGDYSREEDRHLVKAEVPPVRPDVLIVESTYGVQSHEPREEKELRFTNLVHSILRRGGHVLLPAFALGRAQELLLILDEYWKKHPDLHNVPIYYASSLARKCMAVYQTYIHTMNANIRSRFARRDNPFVFKHISNVPQSRGWERKIAEGPPCVVLASPGFMQTGPSRELLELWAPDPRNGLIVTGYSIEGTMAREIMNEPDEIITNKGVSIPRKISVDYISFSAHVDYTQNSEFIELVKAPQIVLVHGEQTAMGRLRAALQAKFKNKEEDVKIHMPRNLERLNLTFRGERVAKAIGSLAAKPPKPNDVLSGLLVAKDYSYTLLDPRDLRDFAGLSTCIVTQRQKIALGVGWDLVRWHLEGMYGSVEEGVDKDGISTMRVGDGRGGCEAHERARAGAGVGLERANDMIADSTLALISDIDKSPASVKLTAHSHACHHTEHPHSNHETTVNPMARIQRLGMFLEAHFGEVEYHMPEEEEEQGESGPGEPSFSSNWTRRTRGSTSCLCESEGLRKRVQTVLDMAVSTVSSLSESFVSGEPLDSKAPATLKEKSVEDEQPREQPEGQQQDPQDPQMEEASVQPAPEQSESTKENGAADQPLNASQASDKPTEDGSSDVEEDEDAMLQVHD